MRLHYKAILAVVTLIVVAAVPLQAAKIQPGVYQLEWKAIYPIKSEFWNDFPCIEMYKMKPDQIEKHKLVSSYCMAGGNKQMIIIIDESQGTGKGFDTAYVVQLPPKGESFNLDLTKALKLPLKRSRGGVFYSDVSKEYSLEFPYPTEDGQVLRKTGISIEIYTMDEDEFDEMPFVRARVNLLGSWAGKVKTDTGEILVQLSDNNNNGSYCDMFNARDYFSTGDSILFCNRIKSGEYGLPADEACIYSKAVAYQGELYEAKISKTGDTIEFKQFKGPVGKLRILAKNGNGDPLKVNVTVYGDAGVFNIGGGGEMNLPAGTYKCSDVTLVSPSGFDKSSIYSISVKRPIIIQNKQTTAIKLGGPISIKINPGSDIVTVKRGETLQVELGFTAGAAGKSIKKQESAGHSKKK